jgi:DNA-directed RNA polymerase specialized sigma subunit, sigma24 homolog
MTTRIKQDVKHAIDDLASEVFLRLSRELGDVAIEDPQGSLCTTLVEIEKECRTLAPAAPAANSRTRRPKASNPVERALQALAPDQRDALFLHLGKGMTCLEISRQTGIPREAVLNDLLRAYSRLRMVLNDDLRDIC